MSSQQEARDFAAKRSQAEQAAASAIDGILREAARDITNALDGITVASSEAVFLQMAEERASGVASDAQRRIDMQIRQYAKASVSALGDKDTGATGRLLNSRLFGRTFTERSAAYMADFIRDVARMAYAGRRLGKSKADTADAIAQQYRDPYTNGIINTANRAGAGISAPSNGLGMYRSAYGNIMRNAQGTVAIAWGREQKNFARRNGATGFRIHRGSSYPCDICDGEVAKGIQPLDAPTIPFHVRCRCWAEYIYPTQKE